MNILMLGHWLPAPRRPEEARRAHRFARRLAASHQLTLGFVTDDPNPIGSIGALRAEFGDLEFSVVPRGWKSLASAMRLAAGQSCSMAYFRSSALSTRLRDRSKASRYDAAYVSSSSMIPYALEIDPAVPVVMDFGEVDSEWWLRQAERRSFPGARLFRTEAARLRRGEAAAARRAARCVVSSDPAARVLASFAPRVSPAIIPDGVDAEHFTPVLRLPPTPTVVFVSPIESEAEANEAADFCLAVVPPVRARIAEARFVIVSRQAPPAARRIEQLGGVEVAAPVTDMRPFLHRAAVAIAPLAPSYGVQSSVLEAMAMGLPVVTTRRGAEGLGGTPGRELYVEDQASSFAQRIIELLERPPLRAEIGARGATFVRTQYAWDGAAARLAEVVEGLGPSAQRARGIAPEPRMRILR